MSAAFQKMSSADESESSVTSASQDSDALRPPFKRQKWLTGKPVSRSTAQRWLAAMSSDADDDDVGDDDNDDNINEAADLICNNNGNDPEGGNDVDENPDSVNNDLEPADDFLHSQDSDSSSSSSDSSSSSSSSSNQSSSSFSSNSATSSVNGDATKTDTEAPMGERLYPGSKLTKGEVVSKLLDLCCRHAASKALISDLVQFTYQLLPRPNTFPKTLYFFEKDIGPYIPPELSVVHWCCEKCGTYLGTGDNVKIDCGVCKETSMKSFYEFPLETQIKYLFEERNLADAMDSYTEKVGDISDVTKGEEYLKVKSKLHGKYDVILLSSTDGLRPHKNSEEEIWALTYTICEVPPSLRKVFTLVSQIWCGKKKPFMNGFLIPFAKSLNNLYNKGVKWTHPRTKEDHTTKGTGPAYTLDAPARAMTQNVTLYSGFFGCNVCEIEGERIQSGKGFKTIFPYEEDLVLRTKDSMKNQTKAVLKTGIIEKGVRGESILNSIPECDRSSAVIMDYMHLVLLGITRQFFSKWFGEKMKKKRRGPIQQDNINPWYIGHKAKEIDIFLRSIKGISEFTRFPKNVLKFKNYKASTWLVLLLFVSVPALHPHLPQDYFQHWLLLVIAMNLLLQETITEAEIEMSRLLLSVFVEDAQKLYGKDIMSYNLHGLQHMPLMAKRWGGLWCHSTFLFESFNGVIIRNLHGTVHISEEFGNVLGRHVANATLRNQLNLEKDKLSYTTVVKGKQFYHHLTEEELGLLRHHIPNAQQHTALFSRVQQGKTVYTSMYYTAEHAADNKNVLFKTSDNEKVFGICKYFYDNEGEILAFIYGYDVDQSEFKHTDTNLRVTHIIPVHETEDLCVVPFKNIQSKVIKVGQYVCVPPNRFERNL